MLPKYVVLNVKCDRKYQIRLTPSQRKLLHLLDIEMSSKNPNLKCFIECEHDVFSFKFSHELFKVHHICMSTDELFPKIEKFRESFRYLECDLSSTSEQSSRCSDGFDYVKAEKQEKDKVKNRFASYIVSLCGSY